MYLAQSSIVWETKLYSVKYLLLLWSTDRNNLKIALILSPYGHIFWNRSETKRKYSNSGIGGDLDVTIYSFCHGIMTCFWFRHIVLLKILILWFPCFIGTCDGTLVSLNSQLRGDLGVNELSALTINGYTSYTGSRDELIFLFDDIVEIALIQFEIVNVDQVTMTVDEIGSTAPIWVRSSWTWILKIE